MIGIIFAVPVGLGVAMAVLGRSSVRMKQDQIDADRANVLSNWWAGEYLPPPDDGRPPH